MNDTLLTLLGEYQIIIPRVQRDYVQGLDDGDKGKVTIIRRNLLANIKSAFEDERSTPLGLNFIYGKIVNDKIFYPVDGQQRLTTLFLLHVYAFYNCPEKTEILNRFSFEARVSSKTFFKELVVHRESIFNNLNKPSETILDAFWFLDSWKYDPSVVNSINTLDDIYRTKFDVEKLKAQLEIIDNPKVFFNFVKIDNLGQKDDLYIKLNERGKPLSLFDNFKSIFIDTNVISNELLSKIKTKLDNEWANLFWKMDQALYDTLYLRFFEYMFCNYGLIKIETNKQVSKYWVYDFEFNRVEENIYIAIYNLLSYLENNIDGNIYNIIRNALNKNGEYSQKILFHAVTLFLSNIENVNDIDDEKFGDWMRVVKNLINNSRIEEKEPYESAIATLNNLAQYKNEIINYLQSNSNINHSGFDGSQFDEECKKARIMSKGIEYKNAIISAEDKLEYFNGQIRSAINASSFESELDITLFNDIVNKISMFFDGLNPRCSKHLRQALATFDIDYRPMVGRYYTLCVNNPHENSKTPSFKRLFSNNNEIVKMLLDKLNVSNDVEIQLDEIIANDHHQENTWNYCIVHYYDYLIGLINNNHLRMIYNSETTDWLLVKNLESSGTNYSIFLNTLEKFVEDIIHLEYYTENGLNGERYLHSDNNRIKISYINNHIKVNIDEEEWNSGNECIFSETKEYLMSKLQFENNLII